MPTIVTAKDGDCLCGIASDFGFFNCQPIRDLAENAAVLNRELVAGDQITVPDLAVEDHSRAVDSRHKFKLRTSPPVNIRFVHGSPNLPYRDDATVPVLNVSNFVTNLGGSTGLRPFPTGFGFNDDGHQDPDTFKVEVWDPAAGGSVNVKLEALKPIYAKDPVTGVMTVTSFVDFGDPRRRIDALVCNVVSAATSNTYRSKYMRLVVDESDRDEPSVAGQVLFVSDMADGLGTGLPGDNDTVEILDQTVRAIYEVQRCPANPKCRVSVVAPIGGSERKRIRLHYHIFRDAPGSANMAPGLTLDTVKQHLRFRTFKWYRRVLSQANISPKLEAIDIHEPPQENMICLSHGHGNTAVAGSNLTFDVATPTVAATRVTVALQNGETPLQVGNRVAAALPAGFSSSADTTPLALGRTNKACDVLITANNGERVTITNATIPPAGGMTVDTPRPVSTSVNSRPTDGSLSFLTTEIKRYFRMVNVTDEALHCILIRAFAADTPFGRAFMHNFSIDPAFQPDLPFRSATIMGYTAASGGILDNRNDFSTVAQHESTHILADLIHTVTGSPNATNQLMHPFVQHDNTIDMPKRLNGGPFTVALEQNRAVGGPITLNVILADRIRTIGDPKMEGW